MKKRPDFRVASIILPLTATLVCAGVFLYENRQFGALQAELDIANKQYVRLVELLKEMESKKGDNRFPLVAHTVREQPIFLNTLRQYADLNRVQLMKWSITPNSVATAKPDPDAPPKPKSVMDDVTPIVNNVEIAGSYANVRAFLYDVARFPRLVTMNDAKYSRSSNTAAPLKVVFTLARYVAPVGKAPDDTSVSPGTSTAAFVPGASGTQGAPGFKPSTLGDYQANGSVPTGGNHVFKSGAMYNPSATDSVEKVMSAGSASQAHGATIAPAPKKVNP